MQKNKEHTKAPPLCPSPGRLMPQAEELERAVLGALLIETRALEEVEPWLSADDFYTEPHQLIYAAIQSLQEKHRKIDMLTVTEELHRRKHLDAAGGPYYISCLTSGVASSSHIVDHTLIIREKSKARQLIRVASSVLDRAYDPSEDPEELMEWVEREMTAVVTRQGEASSIPLGEALQDAIRKAEEAEVKRQQGKPVAITTGLKNLDKALDGGFNPAELILLGARPSMGKTQLALSFAKAAAGAGYHTLFVTMETPERQLATRYLLEDERIERAHMKTGTMTAEEWKAVDETAGKLWNLPLYMAGKAEYRTLPKIVREARRLKRLGKLDILFIDYLQLMRTKGRFENRNNEIAHYTAELKNLALELDIPVVLLSQLNRQTQEGAAMEPRMKDLRDSGAIEQDADVIILLHRPSYYDAEAMDLYGRLWKGRGKLLLVKNRESEARITILFHHDTRFKKITDEEG